MKKILLLLIAVLLSITTLAANQTTTTKRAEKIQKLESFKQQIIYEIEKSAEDDLVDSDELTDIIYQVAMWEKLRENFNKTYSNGVKINIDPGLEKTVNSYLARSPLAISQQRKIEMKKSLSAISGHQIKDIGDPTFFLPILLWLTLLFGAILCSIPSDGIQIIGMLIILVAICLLFYYGCVSWYFNYLFVVYRLYTLIPLILFITGIVIIFRSRATKNEKLGGEGLSLAIIFGLLFWGSLYISY
ncbi:MAG: hypothetical protein WCW02_00435 [Candidatus Buchananbacteria bacterium]